MSERSPYQLKFWAKQKASNKQLSYIKLMREDLGLPTPREKGITMLRAHELIEELKPRHIAQREQRREYAFSTGDYE